MRLQSWGFDGDSMGIEGSDQGVAGIDAAAGKKVSSGSPPRRGERIEETARVIGGRRPRRAGRIPKWPEQGPELLLLQSVAVVHASQSEGLLELLCADTFWRGTPERLRQCLETTTPSP